MKAPSVMAAAAVVVTLYSLYLLVGRRRLYARSRQVAAMFRIVRRSGSADASRSRGTFGTAGRMLA